VHAVPVCLHILTYSLFFCREIAELKVLLESQTELNASLQRELQEGQQKVAAISQVELTPYLRYKARRSFYSHRNLFQMYSASLDSVLFTHDQLVYCLCIVLSSVVNARYAGLHDQQ